MELLILDFYYIKRHYTLKFIPLLKNSLDYSYWYIYYFESKQFEKIALKPFSIWNNVVYKEFCDLLQTNVSKVKSLQQIPFYQFSFLKSSGSFQYKSIESFTSSGTTEWSLANIVTDASLYEESYRKGFSEFYGDRKLRCSSFATFLSWKRRIFIDLYG
jgi:hypothetical protein